MKYAARRDLSEPAIVAALEAAGCSVYRKLPVDLLVWHPRFGKNNFMLVEVKSPQKRGERRSRKDQPEQDAFCQKHGVPYVVSAEAAVGMLNMLARVKGCKVEIQ